MHTVNKYLDLPIITRHSPKVLNISVFLSYGDEKPTHTKPTTSLGMIQKGHFVMIISYFLLILATGLFASLVILFNDKRGKIAFLLASHVTFLLFILLLISNRGVFGEPYSLSKKEYYKILSVTVLDANSTVIILKDGGGASFPIVFRFHSPYNTNGLYTLYGNTMEDFRLIPIE